MVESYEVLTDNKNAMRIKNASVSVVINGKQTVAIVPEIDLTYEQLVEQVNILQKQYDDFKRRNDLHLKLFQTELTIAKKRMLEAEKLNIVPKGN